MLNRSYLIFCSGDSALGHHQFLTAGATSQKASGQVQRRHSRRIVEAGSGKIGSKGAEIGTVQLFLKGASRALEVPNKRGARGRDQRG